MAMTIAKLSMHDHSRTTESFLSRGIRIVLIFGIRTMRPEKSANVAQRLNNFSIENKLSEHEKL